ncbi:MAG: AcvB/VirJ family lysyl-phosphatidylglycerol hydrolase [Candidatus Zixiibacteriota bacterium]
MKAISLFVLIFLSACGQILGAAGDALQFGRFGDVWLYHKSPRPSQVVLFVSGDGGWNKGVVDMAKALSSMDALVVGIDIVHYLKQLEESGEKCSYPAGDFELLSKFVQRHLNYPDYVVPTLVGYSSGATLVYAALVQAPSISFRGAISLGFCPDLPLTKPFCRGSGLEWKTGPKGKGFSFLPAKDLENPWIVLQGTVDQVCSPSETEEYVKQVGKAHIMTLPSVGHGFSVQKNWMPQFKSAFAEIASDQTRVPDGTPSTELKDLPLVEFPANDTSKALMAVHVSGDGGYGVTDKGISRELASRGIPVVGLNSLKYFWKKRTPEEAAKDLKRILDYYLTAWKKKEILLVGYSLGADVLPFMINRLPDTLRSAVRLVVLMGPSHEVEFEFHITEWLGGSSKKNSLSVLPEVEKLKRMRLLCLYGEDDKDTICPELDTNSARVISEKGGHRVGGNFGPIVQEILQEVK